MALVTTKSSARMVAASLIALQAFSGAAHGQAQAPQEADASKKQVVVTGKRSMICRSSVPTGSIMPKRVCKTPEQWEEARAQSILTLERIRKDRDTQQMVQQARENQ